MTIDTGKNLKDPSYWTGESSIIWRQVLGKLLEELGELTAAASRCLIQGIDKCHPVTNKPNIDWLMEEIADVQNLLRFVDFYAMLSDDDATAFQIRMSRKYDHIAKWLAVL